MNNQPKKTQKLTPMERRIVILLHSKTSPDQIRSQLLIEPKVFKTHISSIRSKLGIEDLTDSHKLAKHIRKERNYATPAQWKVLRLYAKGMSHGEISRTLGINIGTSMNQLSQACIRLGIDQTGAYRLSAIRRRILLEDSPMNDPMFF
jgi:DNA-binding NarL/FixJ family response regulator